MARPTRRQRLKRDPSNQPWHKLRAWAKKDGRVQYLDTGKGLMKLMPRIVWNDEWTRYMGLMRGRYWHRQALSTRQDEWE